MGSGMYHYITFIPPGGPGKLLQQQTYVYAVPLYEHAAPHGAAPNPHMRAKGPNGSDRDCLLACVVLVLSLRRPDTMSPKHTPCPIAAAHIMR
eukprot:5645841-Heterocapsa_arctica.AAC.1